MARILENWDEKVTYTGTDPKMARRVNLSNLFIRFNLLPNVGKLVDENIKMVTLGSDSNPVNIDPSSYIQAANAKAIATLEEGLAFRRQGIDPDLDKLGY
jgi:hypothetical protein